MNILLLGSGGRENALAWKMAQSPRCTQLFIAPGNAGSARFGTNVNIAATDFPALKSFCLEHRINMVVVGPEDPLVRGVADFFAGDESLRHIIMIGPGKTGAQLEGSKEFSKRFMIRHGIPTAAYASFTKETLEEGYRFLETLKPPYVLKADGLAAGKGVLILHDLQEARQELKQMLQDLKFGAASEKVVIEEFLDGIELSVFVLTDGKNYVTLPAAKDYKRIGEGDTGLNTGGMGAVSPVPFAGMDFMKKVEERIIRPTVAGLHSDAIPYTGFIFIGLMNKGGEPYVIEYNVRMGDPETEVVIPRLKNDLVELLMAAGEKRLNEMTIEQDPRVALTVILASGGYPGDFEKGKVITGTDSSENSLLFHAGTAIKEGQLITSGGRVMAVTSFGNTIAQAQAISMNNAAKIQFENKYFRKDIGNDLMG